MTETATSPRAAWQGNHGAPIRLPADEHLAWGLGRRDMFSGPRPGARDRVHHQGKAEEVGLLAKVSHAVSLLQEQTVFDRPRSSAAQLRVEEGSSLEQMVGGEALGESAVDLTQPIAAIRLLPQLSTEAC